MECNVHINNTQTTWLAQVSNIVLRAVHFPPNHSDAFPHPPFLFSLHLLLAAVLTTTQPAR